MMPFARIDCASSSNRSCSKTRRGWKGLASIWSISRYKGVSSCLASSAAVAGVWSAVGRPRIRASMPLPSALRGSGLFMVEDLLGELDITFGALRTGVVGEDRLPEAGSFGQTNTARNDGFEN